jgi:hypothetical protein
MKLSSPTTRVASGVGVCMANIRPDLRDYAGPSALFNDSLDEALKTISQPFFDELRQLGFEQAQKSDILQHRSLLFQFWQMPQLVSNSMCTGRSVMVHGGAMNPPSVPQR